MREVLRRLAIWEPLVLLWRDDFTCNRIIHSQTIYINAVLTIQDASSSFAFEIESVIDLHTREQLLQHVILVPPPKYPDDGLQAMCYAKAGIGGDVKLSHKVDCSSWSISKFAD